MGYLCGYRGSPRQLRWECGRPRRQGRAMQPLSPVTTVSISHIGGTIGGLAKDILLGRVMITEYPLSVVFSICLGHVGGRFDLDRTSHCQTNTCELVSEASLSHVKVGTPVFPDVGSMTTLCPGMRVTSFSASSTMRFAMRSLTEPPDDMNSVFPTIQRICELSKNSVGRRQMLT